MEATHSILANIIYSGNRHLGQSALIKILNKHIFTPPHHPAVWIDGEK